MDREKHRIGRIWYYLWFQESTESPEPRLVDKVETTVSSVTVLVSCVCCNKNLMAQNNTYLFSSSSRCQKSKITFTGGEIRVSAGLQEALGENGFLDFSGFYS